MLYCSPAPRRCPGPSLYSYLHRERSKHSKSRHQLVSTSDEASARTLPMDRDCDRDDLHVSRYLPRRNKLACTATVQIQMPR